MSGETQNIETTASTGDRLATLEALRGRLAAEIDGSTSKRDTAQLSQRLMDVLEQIDVVRLQRRAEATTGSPLSVFQQRLAERQNGKASA